MRFTQRSDLVDRGAFNNWVLMELRKLITSLLGRVRDKRHDHRLMVGLVSTPPILSGR